MRMKPVYSLDLSFRKQSAKWLMKVVVLPRFMWEIVSCRRLIFLFSPGFSEIICQTTTFL